jgi:CheY-like chemotaxis protein
LADVLEAVGYHIIQAADAAQALIILRTDASIDVLVTDLTMPGVDGITLIRRAREFRCDLPTILLTGCADDLASLSTIAGGNVQVLRKPFGCDRLIEQLELLVGKPAEA